MDDKRRELGSLLLFTLGGPVIGSMGFAILAKGLMGILGVGVIFFLVILVPSGWTALLIYGAFPGLIAWLLGLFARLAGLSGCYYVSVVAAGACMGLASVLMALDQTVKPDALLAAAFAGVACSLADLHFRSRKHYW